MDKTTDTKHGTLYPTNRKGYWVIITEGESKAYIACGRTRDIAVKRFFESHGMKTIKSNGKITMKTRRF